MTIYIWNSPHYFVSLLLPKLFDMFLLQSSRVHGKAGDDGCPVGS